MSQNPIGINILTALASKFEAEKNVAFANLSVYVNNPAGIGEHGEIVQEAEKLIEQIANADEKLKIVQSILTPQEDKNE